MFLSRLKTTQLNHVQFQRPPATLYDFFGNLKTMNPRLCSYCKGASCAHYKTLPDQKVCTLSTIRGIVEWDVKNTNQLTHHVPMKDIVEYLYALKHLTLIDVGTACGCNFITLLGLLMHHYFRTPGEMLSHYQRLIAYEPINRKHEEYNCVNHKPLASPWVAPIYVTLTELKTRLDDHELKKLALFISWPYPSCMDHPDVDAILTLQPEKVLLLVGLENECQSIAGSLRLWSSILMPLKNKEVESVKIGKSHYKLQSYRKYPIPDLSYMCFLFLIAK